MFHWRRKTVAGVLVFVMAASPSWAYAQAGASAPPPDKVDLGYVPPGALVSVATHPRRVLTSPQMEMMPIEVISALGKKEFGIDPLEIEDVMVIAEPPVQGPPGYGVVMRLTSPFSLDSLKLPPDLPLAQTELEGRPYRQAQNPMLPSFYMPDDRTLLVGTDPFLKKMLANRKSPVEGPLSRLMAKTSTSADVTALAVVGPVRPMLTGMLSQAPLPPPFEGVKRLPELIEAAKIDLTVTARPGLSLVLLAPDDSSAEELETLLNQLLDTGQQMALTRIASELKSDDPVDRAGAQYAQRIGQRIVEMFRPQRTGRMVRIAQEGDASGQVATVGMLVALLFPAVPAAREAARRAQSVNNLKQLGLAMHNYADGHGSFPPRAIFDADGKPLLSWRVELLPFLGQEPLYDQFHLDEPWDSEHNKALVNQMPPVFRNPSSPAPPGRTDYLVPAGKGSIFEGREGTPFSKITDGVSNTLLVVEVNPDAAVIWTKPDDFVYQADNPLVGLGKAHPGGFNATMGDGSVRFIPAQIDPKVFLRLLKMADGQPVGQY
jgi:prepilin-type processing-associated H-X9-DG protein